MASRHRIVLWGAEVSTCLDIVIGAIQYSDSLFLQRRFRIAWYVAANNSLFKAESRVDRASAKLPGHSERRSTVRTTRTLVASAGTCIRSFAGMSACTARRIRNTSSVHQQQGNFEKIVMPPTCLWFLLCPHYLFN